MAEIIKMKASKNKLLELRTIMTKMPLQVCCVTALPEFGVRWSDVARAVRNARLPMTPASIARVIHRHVAKDLSDEELEEIVARLRLKLMATQNRTWHVINLLEPMSDEPVNVLTQVLPSRVVQALKKSKIGQRMTPEVQTVKMGDLLYMSIQLVSATKQSAVWYIATPPGQPVMLISSPHSGLMKAVVPGLGYQKYEDASLNGRDVASLLRIHNQGYTDHASHLDAIPEYTPMPVVTANGVDYTNRTYDEQYVQGLLGPNPPKLTSLTVKSTKPFFDAQRLNKKMTLTVQLRSEDIATTLADWASRGALAPTSDLFHIFHKIKSNKITYEADELE